jgi:membrane protease YdiL (CAAX protease family)
VVGEAGLALLALALGPLVGLSPRLNLRADWSAVLWGLGATGPLLVGLAWVLSRPRGPLRDLTDMVVERLGPILASRTTAELMLLAALAGIAEELLFRGVVQAGLTRFMPATFALVTASVVFGLAHFATLTYALLAGVMGLYLGILFLVQGSLMAPIITHGLYDLAALLAVVHRYRTSGAAPAPAT